MQKNNISSMVEAGILSAIAVIFAAVSIYIPMLGIFLNIFWPVPLILLGVRHGLKWSVMSLITAGLLLAIIVSPLQSLVQVMGLGLIGLTLGYCLNKEKSPGISILCGSIASFISKAAVLLLSFWVIGTNPLDFGPETISKVVDDTLALYRSFGMSEEQIAQSKTMIMTVMEIIRLSVPALFIMASISDVLINFLAAKVILKRLGTNIPGLPSFKNWILPEIFLPFFGLSLIMIRFTQDSPDSIYYRITVNFFMLFGTFLLIQGIAVCWFIIEREGWPNLSKGLLVSLLFINVLIAFIIICVGMFDYIFDFRKIRPKNR